MLESRGLFVRQEVRGHFIEDKYSSAERTYFVPLGCFDGLVLELQRLMPQADNQVIHREGAGEPV